MKGDKAEGNHVWNRDNIPLMQGTRRARTSWRVQRPCRIHSKQQPSPLHDVSAVCHSAPPSIVLRHWRSNIACSTPRIALILGIADPEWGQLCFAVMQTFPSTW